MGKRATRQDELARIGVAQPSGTRRRPGFGLIALAFYAAHASYHLLHHHPEEVIWVCHVATLLVGVGFLTASATANGIAFLWLLMGDLLWGLDLASGGTLLPTSLLTHVGGLVLSIYGLLLYGMPRHVWWQSVVAFLVLQQVCRWITPAASNVNVAFAVWDGWEAQFRSYHRYIAMLTALALAVSFTVEQVTRRLLSRRVRAA